MTWLYKDSDIPGILDIFTFFFLLSLESLLVLSVFSGLCEFVFSSFELLVFVLLFVVLFEIDVDETSSFISLPNVFLGSGRLNFQFFDIAVSVSSFFVSCFDSIGILFLFLVIKSSSSISSSSSNFSLIILFLILSFSFSFSFSNSFSFSLSSVPFSKCDRNLFLSLLGTGIFSFSSSFFSFNNLFKAFDCSPILLLVFLLKLLYGIILVLFGKFFFISSVFFSFSSLSFSSFLLSLTFISFSFDSFFSGSCSVSVCFLFLRNLLNIFNGVFSILRLPISLFSSFTSSLSWDFSLLFVKKLL